MNLYINPCDTFAVILFNDKATWVSDNKLRHEEKEKEEAYGSSK